MATATKKSRHAKRQAESVADGARTRAGGGLMATTVIASPPPSEHSGEFDPRSTYTCSKCGHVLAVYGRERHRVYFELSDARLAEPVMSRVCPGCGLGLPGKNPA
jgi:hypothetical protein